MKEKDYTHPEKSSLSISVWLLIALVVAFGVGIVATLLVQQALSEGQVALSTSGLLSFVFTVALGTGSIVLAIIAIVLSKQAESALTTRNDEGIRLQNEVFFRTSEVLSKIEASTVVTEKRIEDMIAGRAGLIAQDVINKSFQQKPGIGEEVLEKLKEDLAASLKKDLIPFITSQQSTEYLSQDLIELEERVKVSSKWRRYRTNIMKELHQVSGLQVVTEAEGRPSAETSAEFWDILLKYKGKTVGVEIHTRAQLDAYKDLFTIEYVKKMAWRAFSDNLDVVFLLWDKDASNDAPLGKFTSCLEELKKPCPIVWLVGTPKEVTQKIVTAITQE